MRNYKGLIFTNHALQRLRERGISEGDAWATWKNADQSRYAKSRGAWIFYKTYGNTKIEVVAKYTDKKEWVVLSVWSREAYSSEGKKKNWLVSAINFLFFRNKV